LILEGLLDGWQSVYGQLPKDVHNFEPKTDVPWSVGGMEGAGVGMEP